jgi:hypothetical protein
VSSDLHVDASSNSMQPMVRSSGSIALAFVVMFTVGGVLCAQTEASTARCCTRSCPASQHQDSTKCCSIHPGQGFAEVAPVYHQAHRQFPTAILKVAISTLPESHLRTLAFAKIHPPPGLNLSPERLCSLQI